jgi:hypothetical protein
MKRILASIIISLTTAGIMAQGEFDALKFNQSDINGTARYISMGGAFTALGGDASAIQLNPAGLGVYRSSEFSITSGLYNNVVNSQLNGVSSSDNCYRFPLNNLSFILNFGGSGKKGLVNSSFAVTFNKVKNFNRNVYIKGAATSSSLTDYLADFTNSSKLSISDLTYVESPYYEPFNQSYVPWLSVLAFETYLIDTVGSSSNWKSILNSGEMVVPTYSLTESGYINEWAFTYGANISNKLYLGAALGVKNIDYNMTSEYTEDFGLGGGFKLTNDYYAYGSGVNLKLGTIIKPVNFLRLGVSIATPTVLYMTERYSSKVQSTITKNYSMSTPVAESTYHIQGPLELNTGIAFILGKVGLLSVDYNLTDYSAMTLRDDNGSKSAFSEENTGISNILAKSQSLKIGAEVKLNENFSIRGGYGLVTTATNDNAKKLLALNTTRTDTEYFTDKLTHYYSTGLGYREGNWFFDLAYTRKEAPQDYYAYNSTNVSKAKVDNYTNNFVATLGFKF